ncbi:baseplate J/gp47 family protein [Serratia marcescens]|uniref:baseplate J/gp47 family protein n=1 Tax=Serratia marcescens TaxID=615 RepID=UPI0007C8934A|nr:baseplate J/gp47 family protein [Serratia marcescens]OAH27048.1 phage baseplate protein [Serratia marcescens]
MADSNFSRPTLPQLITNIRSDLLTQFQQDVVLRRLDAEVYGRVQAAAVHTLYGYIDYLARNMLPDLADEDWLESRHAPMKRCPRKDATAANGFVRWEGIEANVAVEAGTIIQREDQVTFTTTAAAKPSAGVLRVPVRCDEPGKQGNTDDGITMQLLVPISGLPSSGKADSISGGNDIEPLEEWRSRIIERWYWTPQGGADQDYVIWAKEVPGVNRAWTYRHWMGTGTVGVMIANNDLVDPIPDQSVVDAARDHIIPLAPVAGASIYVFVPIKKVVNFKIRLTPDTEEVRFAVLAELRAMVQRDGYPESKLELSRISEAISIAAGEYSHELIEPSADIPIGKNELGVVGEVLWD